MGQRLSVSSDWERGQTTEHPGVKGQQGGVDEACPRLL